MDYGLIAAVAGVVAAGSFLGGVTGFGYGLLASPLLLALGIPLPTVVVLNLMLGLVTRITVVWRLHAHVTRRAWLLVAGSVPGYAAGSLLLRSVDTHWLKVTAGAMVVGLTLAQLVPRLPRLRVSAAQCVGAGTVGGVLGATTSLNGVVPAMLFSQADTPPRRFIADLATYFVAANAVGLAATWLAGVSAPHLWVYFAASLPMSVAANAVGVTLAPRLPPRTFRAITMAVSVGAGMVAILT